MPQVKEELLSDEVYIHFINEAVKRSDAFGFDINAEDVSEACLSFLKEIEPYRVNPANCSNTSDHMIVLNEITKEYLLKPNSILDWSAPDFPNDLAFYKNGYCWFFTNIREGEVNLCVDTESDLTFWNQLGIEFYDDFDYFNDVVNRIICKYDFKSKIIDNEIIG